jgi:parallel beta-helix repeat protein
MSRNTNGRGAVILRGGQVAALTAAVLTPGAGVAVAGTLYVDNGNPACSNTGPGSSAVPFCTISAAALNVGPGDTVQVSAGNYPEKVTIKVTNKGPGTSAARIVFQADSGVTVGSGQTIGFDLSGVQWVTIRGFTVAGSTTEGMRTQLSSNITLDANRINNAGARGIYAKDCTDCTLKDNVIAHSLSYGIYIQNGLGVKIAGGEVSYSGQPTSGSTRKGVYFYNTSSSSISDVKAHHNSDSGIYVASSSTGIQVARNISFSNARGYTRAAPGVEIRTTTGNLVWGNLSFANEDSGIQLYTGADNNVAVANITYLNGDHGIDVKDSANVKVIGNSVYGNDASGINVEGTSAGATVMNNISVDNGIDSTRTRGNIRVDSTSISGTQMNFNLVYLSQPAGQTMYTWGSTKYPTLQALQNAVPTVEANGQQQAPGWVNAPAPIPANLPPPQNPDDPPPADLNLDSSVAINSADPTVNLCLGGQTARDAAGFQRDAVDRGALEYFGSPPDPAGASFSCGGG